MSPDPLTEILHAFAAIQAELRKLPPNVLGCRLLHWDPELAVRNPGVYIPLNTRTGGPPFVNLGKLYRSKYPAPGQPRSGPGVPERQFAFPHLSWRDHRHRVALQGFESLAARAGQLVAAARDRLSPVLPEPTLDARSDLHRWIFTVYDLAWKNLPDSPLQATRYIPVRGLDESARTDESVRYDVDHLRSVSPEQRFPPGSPRAYLAERYAAWSEQLPVYYASRFDDIIQASDWAIEWLVKYLDPMPARAGGQGR